MIGLRSIFLGVLLTITVKLSAQSVLAKPEFSVPFLLNNEHIIIKVSLENSAPVNFIFDSGAGGTLISRELADSLNFTTRIYRKNVGVSGTHKVGVLRGMDISIADTPIGGVTLLSSNTYFEELDNGEHVYGVIGYALLSRYVTEINYQQGELLFYNRNTYEYTGDGTSLSIDIEQNLPIAKASIRMYNGTEIEGRFMVDTGARSDLIMSSPTVVKYDMAENVGEHYTLRASIGTSERRTKMRYGRVQLLQLGTYQFANLPVALSSDNKGVLSANTIQGIIGNRLLQRFDVIFNYQKGEIILEPSILMGSEYDLNYSGFNIRFEGGKPYIKNLVDRSPADMAGLRNDDQIVSINGVLTESMDANTIRNSFTEEDEQIEIVIQRNGKFKYTEFKLKPLI